MRRLAASDGGEGDADGEAEGDVEAEGDADGDEDGLCGPHAASSAQARRGRLGRMRFGSFTGRASLTGRARRRHRRAAKSHDPHGRRPTVRAAPDHRQCAS
jgi:hypothetical protein